MRKIAHKASNAEQPTVKGEFARIFVDDQIGAAASISSNTQPSCFEVDADENADGNADGDANRYADENYGLQSHDVTTPNSFDTLEPTHPRHLKSNLPRDLQRIWLTATGLKPAINPADIAPELALLAAAFKQARENLAADIAHETRINLVAENARRKANGGLLATEETDELDIVSLLDEHVEDGEPVLPLSAELPLLLTDPQQTLIVSVLRAAFEGKPETLKQLLGSAPCVVFKVPAGIDVKAVARVLPVLLFGPSALVIGLNELLQARVKPRCFVHPIAEDIDKYNGRSFGLLNCIRSNLLRAADFAIPVLVVKAAEVAIPEPIAAVFSARVNLPSLTSAVVDDVIAIAATALNLEPVDFISICSRGQSGGFVRLGCRETAPKTNPATTQNKGSNPLTRDTVLANVAQALAGRAAETIIFGAPDTGSGGTKNSDLAKATQLLGQTHSQHGLGRDGNLVWHPPLAPAKPWPAGIAASIALDLNEQQSRAEAIITANAALVTELAETLMQTKTMNGDVFEDIFAGRVRKDLYAAM